MGREGHDGKLAFFATRCVHRYSRSSKRAAQFKLVVWNHIPQNVFYLLVCHASQVSLTSHRSELEVAMFVKPVQMKLTGSSVVMSHPLLVERGRGKHEKIS